MSWPRRCRIGPEGTVTAGRATLGWIDDLPWGRSASALPVTTLWSSSWVLIRWGLEDEVSPLSFAGLRYALVSKTSWRWPPQRNGKSRSMWSSVLIMGRRLSPDQSRKINHLSARRGFGEGHPSANLTGSLPRALRRRGPWSASEAPSSPGPAPLRPPPAPVAGAVAGSAQGALHSEHPGDAQPG